MNIASRKVRQEIRRLNSDRAPSNLEECEAIAYRLDFAMQYIGHEYAVCAFTSRERQTIFIARSSNDNMMRCAVHELAEIILSRDGAVRPIHSGNKAPVRHRVALSAEGMFRAK